MKVNPILQDIYRGQWLLDAHSILSFAPILSRIIAGEEVIFDKTGAALMQVNDKNGRRLRPNEDGEIQIPEGSVASVGLVGPAVKHGGFCSYGTDEIAGALRFANEHKNIKGIVFNIDGPGGAVSAIGPFLQFAKEKKKPVVAIVDSAYSLHYWAAVAVADVILLENEVTSGVGSVGVVMSFVDTRPVMEEKGYVFHDIYPKESEHKNEAFRLAREKKYDLIKEEHLSPLAQKFQAAVRAGRPRLKEETGVLTGKTFHADKAIALGMADAIGTYKEALEQIDILLELKNFKR